MVSFKYDVFKKVSNVEIFKPSLLDIEVENVEKDSQSCMTDVLEEGLFVLGLQGGYISLDGVKHTNVTNDFIFFFWPGLEGTAYSYYGNSNKVPSVDMVVKGLTSYLDENVPQKCKTDREGVSYGDFKSEVLINDEGVVVNADWFVTVRKENAESKIRKLTVKMPVRLKVLLALFRQMVDDQVKASKEKICLNCWTRLAVDNGLELKIQTFGEDTLFFLLDKKSKIAGGDYPFLLVLMLDKE